MEKSARAEFDPDYDENDYQRRDADIYGIYRSLDRLDICNILHPTECSTDATMRYQLHVELSKPPTVR